LIAAGGLHGGKECVRGTSNTWEYFHFYHTKWWQLVTPQTCTKLERKKPAKLCCQGFSRTTFYSTGRRIAKDNVLQLSY
ncbi:unnamed protein product, partial [Tenebrio molitor]